MIRFVLPLAAAAIIMTGVISCGGESTEANPPESDKQPVAQSQTSPASGDDLTATHEPVPSGVSFTVADIDGQMHHSGEWLGKQPTIINVWGTWCPPCRREIPDLVRLYDEYRDQGIEIVGLAVRDTPAKVRNFATQNEMDWVMLVVTSPQSLATLGQITGVPTTIFFDRDGNEVERFVGPRSYEVFKEAFERIL